MIAGSGVDAAYSKYKASIPSYEACFNVKVPSHPSNKPSYNTDSSGDANSAKQAMYQNYIAAYNYLLSLTLDGKHATSEW